MCAFTLVPVGHGLVGDAGSDVEHDDGGLAADVVAVAQSACTNKEQRARATKAKDNQLMPSMRPIIGIIMAIRVHDGVADVPNFSWNQRTKTRKERKDKWT